MSNKKRVLFVCLGNTCRSTIAEAIFDDYITQNELRNDWQVDSAGLADYHLGKLPDERALCILGSIGIVNYSHKARLITLDDFINFDWILTMDYYNLEELNRIKPENSSACIELLGVYDPSDESVIEDPYCDNYSRFSQVYDQCKRSIINFFAIHQ